MPVAVRLTLAPHHQRGLVVTRAWAKEKQTIFGVFYGVVDHQVPAGAGLEAACGSESEFAFLVAKGQGGRLHRPFALPLAAGHLKVHRIESDGLCVAQHGC